MNGAVAKENRREIRRAFGDQALGVIDSHAKSINDLVLAHTHEVKMRVEHIELAREEAKRGDAVLQSQVDCLFAQGVEKTVEHDKFVGRSLADRFRWLFFGR